MENAVRPTSMTEEPTSNARQGGWRAIKYIIGNDQKTQSQCLINLIGWCF